MEIGSDAHYAQPYYVTTEITVTECNHDVSVVNFRQVVSLGEQVKSVSASSLSESSSSSCRS